MEIRADVVGSRSDPFLIEHFCILSNLSFSDLFSDTLIEFPFRSTLPLLP